MSIVKSAMQARLRFNHRGGADDARELLGVIIEERIPAGSGVYVSVDQPTVLPQTDDAQRNGTVFPSQTFAIEDAVRPLVTSAAGVTFQRRVRTLSVVPGTPGVFVAVQVSPVFAAVAALAPAIPATGLVPKGRYDGFVPDWAFDPNGTVPGSGQRPAGRILRVRWLGPTVEAAEVIDGGSNTGFTFQLLDSGTGDPATDVAPGSVVILATVGGNVITIRDTGAGRLVGQETTANASADGTIDYRAATVTLAFSAATDAVNVTASYEHGCLYLPLDINLEWDAELASG